MPTARIIEAVDALEDRRLGVPACIPRPTPDQLGLDGFKERLDRSIVITVALAAYRHPEALFAQDFLVIVRTALAAPVAVEDAALRR